MTKLSSIRSTSRFNRAILSSISSAVLQVVSIICAFILPGLILSHYGSAYNGVISSITQFLGFFTILQAGIQGATRVALYRTFANNDIKGTSGILNANINYYRKISYILILYILLLAVLFPLIIHDNISKVDIILLVLIIGAGNFIQYFIGFVYKALLCADQSVYVIDIIQTISLVLSTAAMAIIILMNGSVVFAKACGTLFSALNPILLYLYCRKKYKLDKKVEPNKEALRERWQVLANSVANIVHENVDITFITFFCSALEVSVYAIYNLVSSGLIRFVLVLTNGLESAFGDMWAKNEKIILKNNFSRYEFFMFFNAGVLSGCMFALVLPFIELYTAGVDDVNYVRPFYSLILSGAVLTMCIRTPYITLVQAAGKYRETKVGSFVEAGINITLTLILVNIYGISGAVMGTVAANLFRTIQYGHYVSIHLLDRPFSSVFRKMLWLFITTIIVSGMAFIIIKEWAPCNWGEWIICAACCLFFHLLMFSISSMLFYSSDYKKTVQMLNSKIIKHQ